MIKLQKAKAFTAGERKVDNLEEVLTDIKLNINKFTPRKKPKDPRNIVIFPLFSEFGCETLSTVYCLPEVLKKCAGKYTIVMGWHGRSYFYKHLVDEFWEIPEECMWLREYTRAFHHVSKNLKRIEKEAAKIGTVINVSQLSNVAIFPKLESCPHCKSVTSNQHCHKCNITFPPPGLFSDFKKAKTQAVWLPEPSKEKMELVKKYLPKNAIGITARKRKTWGRNLDPIFYERLVYLLEDMGYNCVWIGEKVTSLPCPFKRIVDYSSTKDSEDLETTLALVKQLKFTVQFWTASSRLAAMVGTPYIIMESPDQIWGTAQEGMRLSLMTKYENTRKLICSHYKNCQENHKATLDLVYRAVREIENNNFEDIIGLVQNPEYVKFLRSTNLERIGQ